MPDPASRGITDGWVDLWVDVTLLHSCCCYKICCFETKIYHLKESWRFERFFSFRKHCTFSRSFPIFSQDMLSSDLLQGSTFTPCRLSIVCRCEENKNVNVYERQGATVELCLDLQQILCWWLSWSFLKSIKGFSHESFGVYDKHEVFDFR